MDLIKSFIDYNKTTQLFGQTDKILVGVSGGADSVVLCHLLKSQGITFGIAHVNFSLRDNESDGDEDFVYNLAQKLNVPYYHTRFQTKEYAETNNISIQMAARELRYQWFDKIRKDECWDYIATAHHADDNMETFFINLSKGAGIQGLSGIPAKNGFIIRPLLFAQRADIDAYTVLHNIAYRTDSSNLSDKYQRNFIRIHIIPLFRQLFPYFDKTFATSIENLTEAQKMIAHFTDENASKVISHEGKSMLISISGLKALPAPSSFLYFWLRPYSFSRSVVKEIMDSLDRQAGLVFYSPTHRIIKDRTHLILSHKEDDIKEELLYPISERPEEHILPEICLKTDVFEKTSNTISKDPHIACLDFNKITFPIVLRKWKAGDKFIPLGMNTNKKISDFLTDLKLPLSKKEEVLVLCSNETIIWVVGYRIHNDFKVTEKTSKIFEIKTLHTF